MEIWTLGDYSGIDCTVLPAANKACGKAQGRLLEPRARLSAAAAATGRAPRRSWTLGPHSIHGSFNYLRQLRHHRRSPTRRLYSILRWRYQKHPLIKVLRERLWDRRVSSQGQLREDRPRS